jgi:hypothetical protein
MHKTMSNCMQKHLRLSAHRIDPATLFLGDGPALAHWRNRIWANFIACCGASNTVGTSADKHPTKQGTAYKQLTHRSVVSSNTVPGLAGALRVVMRVTQQTLTLKPARRGCHLVTDQVGFMQTMCRWT